MVEEARLEAVESGLVPATDGWFVVNVSDAAWLTNDAFGARCIFEADTPVVRGTEITGRTSISSLSSSSSSAGTRVPLQITR